MVHVSCDSPFTYRGKKIITTFFFSFFFFTRTAVSWKRFDRLLLLLVKGTEDIFLLNILNQSNDKFWLPHVSECSVLMSLGLRWTHAY